MGDFAELGYPLSVRLAHWFNVLFLTLLIRSGLAILAAHPRLYWNIHCRPGSEWLSFLKEEMPSDRMWCSTDEEQSWPSWLALPGGHGLGLGRYWHFLNALLWFLCGVFYLGVLFLTPQWRRLVPTSWEIVPEAWKTFLTYASFQVPEPTSQFTYDPRLPFNALQQLAYFGVTFFLSPLMILTGLWQSPALLGRLPTMERILNRQAARSIHFLGMLAILGFTLVHLVMVVVHKIPHEMGKMVLGEAHGQGHWLATGIGFGIIAAIVLFHVLANVVSEHQSRFTHRVLAKLVDPVRHWFFHFTTSRQTYAESEYSPHFRINGYPPISAYPQAKGDDDTYERLLANNFADFRLEVHGAVEEPLSLSLEDLRAMPRQDQATLHHCIQGWTSIGRWSGVRVGEILRRCRPKPEAKYLVFWSFGMHEKTGKVYYECVDMEIARHPQTILAYELNGEPLPLQHGAPLRPRFETQLGFKMVKFLRSIELVEDFSTVGGGMGGIREDEQQFNMGAGI